MIVQCPRCGKPVVVSSLGRERLDMPLKNDCEALQIHCNVVTAANELIGHDVTDNVCEALELHCDVGQAAKELGCSVGYIYNACKEHGTAPRDVMKAKAGEQ